MKLLLALAALLTVVGLVWLAISVGEATERGRVHEPVVTPVGVLTPAATPGQGVLTAPAELAAQEPDAPPATGAAEPSRDGPERDGPERDGARAASPASAAAPYAPPDPARFADKHRDLDAAGAVQRAAQLANQLEQRAASVLADTYYKQGRYTAWPYTYDAQGNRQAATSAIPRAELEPIHRIYDAPDERAWHLVVVTPAERPDLYDLRFESRWLGSRGRSGEE